MCFEKKKLDSKFDVSEVHHTERVCSFITGVFDLIMLSCNKTFSLFHYTCITSVLFFFLSLYSSIFLSVCVCLKIIDNDEKMDTNNNKVA